MISFKEKYLNNISRFNFCSISFEEYKLSIKLENKFEFNRIVSPNRTVRIIQESPNRNDIVDISGEYDIQYASYNSLQIVIQLKKDLIGVNMSELKGKIEVIFDKYDLTSNKVLNAISNLSINNLERTILYNRLADTLILKKYWFNKADPKIFDYFNSLDVFKPTDWKDENNLNYFLHHYQADLLHSYKDRIVNLRWNILLISRDQNYLTWLLIAASNLTRSETDKFLNYQLHLIKKQHHSDFLDKMEYELNNQNLLKAYTFNIIQIWIKTKLKQVKQYDLTDKYKFLAEMYEDKENLFLNRIKDILINNNIISNAGSFSEIVFEASVKDEFKITIKHLAKFMFVFDSLACFLDTQNTRNLNSSLKPSLLYFDKNGYADKQIRTNWILSHFTNSKKDLSKEKLTGARSDYRWRINSGRLFEWSSLKAKIKYLIEDMLDEF